MELKTIKEFAHKGNLGEGLKFESGLFQLDLDGEFNTIASSLNQLNTKVTQINEQLGTVYKVKGSTTVAGINSMTVGNAMVGWVYNLTDSGVITNGIGGELDVVKGDNVVYTENGWDEFSASLDLNQCAGQNISIEDNVISATGYFYDKYNKSVIIGSEYNEATGYLAFAQGDGTTASGEKAHAEGGQTIASGRQAHAEGSNTRAKGDFSHTEGKYTKANNEAEHAQGVYNISNTGTDTDNRTTLYSIGVGTSSENKNAHEVMDNGDTFIVGIGEYNGTNPYEAKTLQQVITDLENVESVTYSAGDNIDILENNVISALGYTYDAEKNSFSIGDGTATVENSYAEGVNTKAEGYASHAEGNSTTAYGYVSHAEGFYAVASGQFSHAEGAHTRASEDNSHAEGNSTTASGSSSHSEGQGAVASGHFSHAEGNYTKAKGRGSHSEGWYTEAKNDCEHTQGRYNISHTSEEEFGSGLNTIHSIGMGDDNTTRKNAQEVMQNGDFYIINVGNYNGMNNLTEAQTLQEVVNSKVDKEDNKGLSTEDYTTEEKTKLSNIEEGAQVNIQSDWNQSDETLKDYIKHKPDLTIYQLKEEGKSLTSNDYTTEDKEKLSGIEAGAQVNTVNSVNGQTGDVVIEQLTAGNNINIENNIISAKGYSTDTTKYTFVTGYDTNAIDSYTHAEGFGTKAQGSAAHAEGKHTITNNICEHAQGRWNVSNTNDRLGDCTIHSIGIGDGEEGRKNAQEVMQNGDHYIIGIGNYDGTNATNEEAKTLQEVLNTKEYSLDFKEDLTTIQEINISNTWKLNQIASYNVSSINLSIDGQETQVLTLIDNNWVADSLTTILIYPTNRVVWEIIKADETLPAVLGISKIKQ